MADDTVDLSTVSIQQVVIKTTLDPVPVDVLSNGDLPWAQVLLPTTSSGTAASGVNQHGLQVGTWVFGFFADGDDCQMPVVVGVYSGGPGADAPGGSSGSSVTSTTGTNDGTYTVGGIKGNGSSGTTGSPTQAYSGGGTGSGKLTKAQTGANVDATYRYLREDGWNHVQACGIMGNIQIESSFNPGSRGDGGDAHGICQWHLSNKRWAHFQQYAQSVGKPENDLQTQVKFIRIEMQKYSGDCAGCMSGLQNSQTPEQAATVFMQRFEKPQDHAAGGANDRARGSAARGFATKYESSGMPAAPQSVPTTGGPGI